MHTLSYFQELIEKGLLKLQLDKNPKELYDPIQYMLNLGGKRMRPALLLMSNEMFGGNPEEVLSPALGIEVFHNFTLMHDDIMDKAPLRRSKETVHEKWNPNIAILSGDTMFVQSCQLMMQVNDKHLRKVMDMFHKTSIEVCEGQQFDMNFETIDKVSIDEYLEMIALKTAVLLGGSLAIGAICADAFESDIQNIYQFGKKLGIAFQLQDDLLDVYGDAEKFGKQVGGDIIANKKTFLLISACEQAKGDQLKSLQSWLDKKEFNSSDKVNAVMSIFNDLNIKEQTEKKMDQFFHEAMSHLNAVTVNDSKKELMISFAEKLMVRTS
ncbi:MAG TPA: polyprenyl synthetase family protein [Bacteroidia bacterium]|nr:polyprenyl synthetase family protein [Bacteroidia bacterium]